MEVSPYIAEAVERARLGVTVRFHPKTRDQHKWEPEEWLALHHGAPFIAKVAYTAAEATRAYFELVDRLCRPPELAADASALLAGGTSSPRCAANSSVRG